MTGAVRVSLAVEVDPADPSRRVLVGVKSNVGPLPLSLRYDIEFAAVPDTGGTVSKVRWGEVCDLTADDVMSAPVAPRDRPPVKLEVAKCYLRDALAGGPAWAGEVEAVAKRAGITVDTLRRARDELAVAHKPVGFPARRQWSLPGLGDHPGEGADSPRLKENDGDVTHGTGIVLHASGEAARQENSGDADLFISRTTPMGVPHPGRPAGRGGP